MQGSYGNKPHGVEFDLRTHTQLVATSVHLKRRFVLTPKMIYGMAAEKNCY